ncbi:4a-hydroxytetrahydrobiopterin dehydratase [Cochlodiniinecator piscidefendens]|uniref:4a-hydroxytetrahydrobiopterin dehydratase n=1 Tax=Cochlodiniinecator piscidefendens TaxID=2715756 RepID=UPI001407AA50|nr:4a-hydroxytetrahydrobiopterin dehydratase [Cochlodiniinecator piscidefendens]
MILSGAERETALAPLLATGWWLAPEGDAIHKNFTFTSFNDCFGYMTRCALWAEKWDHHPKWANSGPRLAVTLTTHSAGGLTQLDVNFAQKMDALF